MSVQEKQKALDILTSILSEADRLHNQEVGFFQSEMLSSADLLHKTALHFMIELLKTSSRTDKMANCSWIHNHFMLWVNSLVQLLKGIHDTVRSENE